MATLTPSTTWTITSPSPTTTSSLTPSGRWWKPWDCRLSPRQQSWLAGPRRQLFIICTWPPAERPGNRYGTQSRELRDCRRIIKTFHINIISSLYFNNYTEIINKVAPHPTMRYQFVTWQDMTFNVQNMYMIIFSPSNINILNFSLNFHDLVSSEDQMVKISLCPLPYFLSQFLLWGPFYPPFAWETQICLWQCRHQNIWNKLRSSFW